MGRVSAVAVNPLTTAGDLIRGGAGTPTGYTDRAVPGVTLSNDPVWDLGALPNLVDGNDGTETGAGGFAGSWFRVDFGVARRIGKWRVRQSATANRRASSLSLQSSYDDAAWTTRDPITATFVDSGERIITPITARYWRVLCVTAGPWEWSLAELQLFEVSTVGAGNQERMAVGAEGAVLTIVDGIPTWV